MIIIKETLERLIIIISGCIKHATWYERSFHVFSINLIKNIVKFLYHHL